MLQAKQKLIIVFSCNTEVEKLECCWLDYGVHLLIAAYA